MNELALASPLILAVGFGVFVAGINSAWARWPATVLAGLLACAGSAWLTLMAWGMPFSMALWPVTIPLAFIAMAITRFHRRRRVRTVTGGDFTSRAK